MDKTVSSGPVVVALDGSDESKAAVGWAADAARRRGSPLWLVHAMDFGHADLAVREFPEMALAIRRGAEEMLDDEMAEAGTSVGDIEIRTVLEDGDPSTVLLRQAAHAILVVLGSRGRGGFAGMVLGSTSLKVAMHAPCPVVVLRSAAADASAGPSAGRIVVGSDGSPHSARAVGLAFEEADLRGVGVTAVRTWLAPDIDVDATPAHEWEQAEKDEKARLTEDLLSWRTRFPKVDVVEKTVRGAPAATLIDESEGAEMLVVGSHGRGGFGGLVLGSVSHAALHHAHCPVAVARS